MYAFNICIYVKLSQKDVDNVLGCGNTQNNVTAFLTNTELFPAEKCFLSGMMKQIKWKRILQKTTADKAFHKCEESCFHFFQDSYSVQENGGKK